MAKRKKDRKKGQTPGSEISLEKAPLPSNKGADTPADAAPCQAQSPQPQGGGNKAERTQASACKASQTPMQTGKTQLTGLDASVRPGRPGQKKNIAEDEAAKNGENPVGGQRMVSLSTCCACMFLTFVLGIYLGTLVPGIVNTADKTSNTAVSAPETNAQQNAAPAPAKEPIDPDMKAAIADLEKRVAANPDSAPDWINLGNIYFDAHEPNAAITAYEQALTLAPRNADVLTDLGIMYREIGDFDKAVATFRKAIEVDPRHQNAMFNEGVVLANDLHRNEEAAAAWQRLLDVNPGAVSPGGTPLTEMIKRLHK